MSLHDDTDPRAVGSPASTPTANEPVQSLTPTQKAARRREELFVPAAIVWFLSWVFVLLAFVDLLALVAGSLSLLFAPFIGYPIPEGARRGFGMIALFLLIHTAVAFAFRLAWYWMSGGSLAVHWRHRGDR